MPLERIIALAYGALNLLALLGYGWDKLQAKRDRRRVPERTLHALALLGGFGGAWIGMRTFRHKTQKPFFSVVLVLATLLHGGFWSWWFLR